MMTDLFPTSDSLKNCFALVEAVNMVIVLSGCSILYMTLRIAQLSLRELIDQTSISLSLVIDSFPRLS
jgi:hypothetical protein